jgi:hypothetical protein
MTPLFDYATLGTTPRMADEAATSALYELDHYRGLYEQNEISRTEWLRHQAELLLASAGTGDALILQAGQHVFRCEFDLADCTDCTQYLMSWPKDAANAVMRAAAALSTEYLITELSFDETQTGS